MQHSESWIRLRNLAISQAVFVALVLFATTYSEPVLRASLMPDEPPPVMRHKLKPLIDYPEKKIGMKIEFRPALDGDTLVDALIGKKPTSLDSMDFILSGPKRAATAVLMIALGYALFNACLQLRRGMHVCRR